MATPKIVGMYDVRLIGHGVGSPYRDNSYNVAAEQFYRDFEVEMVIEVEKDLREKQKKSGEHRWVAGRIPVCFGGRKDAVIEEEIALMTGTGSLEIFGNVQLNENDSGDLYASSMSVQEVKMPKEK